MGIRVGSRFAACHSIRGWEYGIVTGITVPGDFVFPQVHVRFDGQYGVQFLHPSQMRILS